MLRNPTDRPPVPERYDKFVIINDMIQTVKQMYDQMPSEAAFKLLRQAQRLKEIWWTEEDQYRQQEWNELFKNFNQWSHSVRVAALDEGLQ